MDFANTRLQMDRALELLRQEVGMIKTGRATPALIERIIVEAYQTKMPLVELATILAPSPSELLVVPFDYSILSNIEKALSMDRNLGLMPAVDGVQIRLKIPPLTEERRQELVKFLHQKLEAGRIMIRQVRADKMRHLRDDLKNKLLSEDEHFRAEGDLQKITDEFNGKIESLGKAKEAELLSI